MDIPPRAAALLEATCARSRSATRFDGDCPVCGGRSRVPWRLVDGPAQIIGKCQKCSATMPEIEEAAGLGRVGTARFCEAKRGTILKRPNGTKVWQVVGCRSCEPCREFYGARERSWIVKQLSNGAWLSVIEDEPNARRRVTRNADRWLSFPHPDGRRVVFTDAERDGAQWIPPSAVTATVEAIYRERPDDARRASAHGWSMKPKGVTTSERVGYFSAEDLSASVVVDAEGDAALRRVTKHCSWIGPIRPKPEERRVETERRDGRLFFRIAEAESFDLEELLGAPEKPKKGRTVWVPLSWDIAPPRGSGALVGALGSWVEASGDPP